MSSLVASNETFADVELLVKHIVNTLFRKYSSEGYNSNGVRSQFLLDKQDMLSEAHRLYMQAYNTYKSEKGTKFSYYVHYKVWNGLHTYLLNHGNHYNPLNSMEPSIGDSESDEYTAPSLLGEESEPFQDFLARFTECLSEDARFAVDLVLNRPKGLNMIFRKMEVTEHRAGTHAIRDYLDDCGWSRSRVEQAFSEIRMLLRNSR